MYIPAVPLTPMNLSYIALQRAKFLAGLPGPDFPQQLSKPDPAMRGESSFVKKGVPEDVGRLSAAGKRALGLGDVPFEIKDDLPEGEKEMLKLANEKLYGAK